MAVSICEVCGGIATNKKKVIPRFCCWECRKKSKFHHSKETKKKLRIARLGMKFTPEWKENHLKAVRESASRPEFRLNMSKAKTGIKQPISGKNGATEKNIKSKYWWFIKDGVHYQFRSLNNFVRSNKHLFTDNELVEYKTEKRLSPIYRATVMLRNLHLIKKNGEPAVPSFEWNGWTIGEKWESGFYDNKPA